jgi:hypothetical protein
MSDSAAGAEPPQSTHRAVDYALNPLKTGCIIAVFAENA